MKNKIKDKFPVWASDITTNFDLLISDDVDSLLCYLYQKTNFNREVKYFFDVNYQKVTQYAEGIQRVFKIKDFKGEQDNVLGLDVALNLNMKTWDNHVVKNIQSDTVNSNSANINSILGISKENYTSKYIVSSFITMLSYYDFDISKWTKEQLSVLCAIDGLYTPFKGNFKSIGRKHLEDLDYGFLADFIENNLNTITQIENKLNLKYGKIKVNSDGKLTTDINLGGLSDVFNIDIELPNGIFIPKQDFKSRYFKDVGYINKENITDKKIFNFALNYKNCGVLSVV